MRWWRRIRPCTLVLVGGLTLATVNSVRGGLGLTDQAQVLDVQVVLDEIDRSRARVPPVSYTLNCVERFHGEVNRTYRSRMEVMRDQDRLRVERHDIIAENGQETLRIVGRAILRSDYRVLINFADESIREWDIAPGTAPPDDLDALFEMFTRPDLLNWGFGIGSGDLRAVSEVTHVRQRLVARTETENGQRFIRVDLLRESDDNEWRVATFRLDPRKGWMIIAGTIYEQEKGIAGQFTVEATELADGVWFPLRVVTRNAAYSNQSVEITINDLRVVEPRDEDFELGALQPAEGARVVHYHSDGRPEPYIVVGGTSVPVAIFEEQR
jgi:hypothetical protein